MSVSPPDFATLAQNKNQVPAVDSKTEEFRKYLENSGILDVMTRFFKNLYEKEDKPADPLAYFIETLNTVSFHAREIVALKDEIKELQSVVENLKDENRILREESEKSSAE